MQTSIVQVSENCWKHTDKNGNVFYSKTSERTPIYHREDGPATEWANGYKAWWINDKRHREDGPAIEFANGDKHWYFNGKRVYVNSQEEFEEFLKMYNC